jgi:hypothetical protein
VAAKPSDNSLKAVKMILEAQGQDESSQRLQKPSVGHMNIDDFMPRFKEIISRLLVKNTGPRTTFPRMLA